MAIYRIFCVSTGLYSYAPLQDVYMPFLGEQRHILSSGYGLNGSCLSLHSLPLSSPSLSPFVLILLVDPLEMDWVIVHLAIVVLGKILIFKIITACYMFILHLVLYFWETSKSFLIPKLYKIVVYFVKCNSTQFSCIS